MKKVRITVIRKARYDDLIARYENPLENACDMEEGQIFIGARGKLCRRSLWLWRTVRKIFTAAG